VFSVIYQFNVFLYPEMASFLNSSTSWAILSPCSPPIVLQHYLYVWNFKYILHSGYYIRPFRNAEASFRPGIAGIAPLRVTQRDATALAKTIMAQGCPVNGAGPLARFEAWSRETPRDASPLLWFHRFEMPESALAPVFSPSL
jgi:hypothetical protein